jgi:MFS family permease
VVMLDIMVMAGMALAGLLLGWVTDRVGSRPVLMPAAALAAMVPLGWMLLPRETPHGIVWSVALYFLNGLAAGGVLIASGRLLLNSVVPPEQSTAYTAIYYAWLGLTGGIAPLLAGCVLATCGNWQTRVGALVVDGNSLLFLGAALLLAAGCWLYGRVRPDDRHTTRSVQGGGPQVVVRLGRPKPPTTLSETLQIHKGPLGGDTGLHENPPHQCRDGGRQ